MGINEMHSFDAAPAKGLFKRRNQKEKSNTDNQAYQDALATCGPGLRKYISPNMEPHEVEIYCKAYQLHPSNAAELKALKLDIEREEAMLAGYERHISLASEAVSGVEKEDLIMLLEVVDQPGFDLNEVFTADGAFIDYEKVKRLHENL